MGQKVKTVSQLSCWLWFLSRGTQGAWSWRDVSAEALWPEKASGCYGGDAEEASPEREAGDAVLKVCRGVLALQCCVGINGRIAAVSGRGSGWKGRKRKPVPWYCLAGLWEGEG